MVLRALDALAGRAEEIKPAELQRDMAPILVEGERIEKAFRVIRDLFVFTNYRLILVDYQGLTGKKVEYMSIPYKSIAAFSVETAGHFDRDSELKIWVRNMGVIEKEFKKDTNILGIQQTLAKYVLSQ